MLGPAIRTAPASVLSLALAFFLLGGLAVGCTSSVSDLLGTDASDVDPNTDDVESAIDQSDDADEAATPVDRPVEAAELVRVVDGDSVELSVAGSATDVRLAAYNAPELYRQAVSDDADQRSCNGEAAKAALAALLEGQSLSVVGDEFDRFGRRLADIELGDGRLISDEMIGQGWGLAVGDSESDREQMKRAAAARSGMWGSVCGLARTTDLVVTETQVDPPGSDRDNLNDEWVQIQNRSGQAIDLTGWVIRDDTTGHRFPLVGNLAPDDGLTVRSGSGTSTESDLFLGETFPVWSNRGETVLLVDPDGVIAHWAFID